MKTSLGMEEVAQLQDPNRTAVPARTRNRGSARGVLVIFLGGFLAVWLYGYVTGAYEIPYLRGVTTSPESSSRRSAGIVQPNSVRGGFSNPLYSEPSISDIEGRTRVSILTEEQEMIIDGRGPTRSERPQCSPRPLERASTGGLREYLAWNKGLSERVGPLPSIIISCSSVRIRDPSSSFYV